MTGVEFSCSLLSHFYNSGSNVNQEGTSGLAAFYGGINARAKAFPFNLFQIETVNSREILTNRCYWNTRCMASTSDLRARHEMDKSHASRWLFFGISVTGAESCDYELDYLFELTNACLFYRSNFMKFLLVRQLWICNVISFQWYGKVAGECKKDSMNLEWQITYEPIGIWVLTHICTF